jgi:hypothetical protein
MAQRGMQGKGIPAEAEGSYAALFRLEMMHVVAIEAATW